MYGALLIKSDADSAMKIKSMLDTRFSNISMILQADSLSQTILLCRQHAPILIFLDTAQLSAEEVSSWSTQLHALCPDAWVLLMVMPDILPQALERCVEMTVMKPIDVDALADCIGRIIQKTEIQIRTKQLLIDLERKHDDLRPQIIGALIRDIAVSASETAICDKLDALNISFQGGFLAAIQGNVAKEKKAMIHSLFEKNGFIVLSSDFFSYSFFLMLKSPLHPSETHMDIRSQLKRIDCYVGVGTFCTHPSELHLSYAKALQELLSLGHVIINKETVSPLSETIIHNLNWLARIIFSYFLMMNESQVRSRLRAVANALSGNDAQTIYSVIFWLYEKLDALFSASFHSAQKNTMPDISGHHSADELYTLLFRMYQMLSSPHEMQRNDTAHQQMRAILYHILNNHTDSHLSLHDVSETLDLSEYYICKLFHSCTDFSFIEFLNMCRIEHAKNLLVANHKIKETTIEVGFHNSSYFGRVFKAYTGTTPREYRASYGTSTY